MTAASPPRPSTTRRAPGKLFIVGEYAVMEPGTPALLVAVDRMASVTVSSADTLGVVVTSDIRLSPVRLRWQGSRPVGQTPDDDLAARHQLTHVCAALQVVAELLAQRGLPPPPPIELTIRSDLHDNGAKLGLGSSGAVSVAIVDATAAHCGIELTPETRYRLAMIASARLDADASGADLAASSWRGWIVYRAPDRAAVLDIVRRRGIEDALRADWPGFAVRRLVAPPQLELQVGWTGRPAATRELVGGPDARVWRGEPAHRMFVTDMTGCVLAAVDALEHGDCRRFLEQIHSARALLAGLDDAFGLGIFTRELIELCQAADAAGWVAKPSGAGGGDCGIALLDNPAPSDMAGLHRRWRASGLCQLPIRVVDEELMPR